MHSNWIAEHFVLMIILTTLFWAVGKLWPDTLLLYIVLQQQ